MAIIEDEGSQPVQDESGATIEDEASPGSVSVSLLSLSLSVKIAAAVSDENIVAVNKISCSLTINAASISPIVIAANCLTLGLALKGLSIAGADITDWLKSQLEQKNWTPERRLYIGTSDYSTRVAKWPTIKRTANELKSTEVKIPLVNEDRTFNNFFEQTYYLVNTISIEIGATHPTSGFEGLRLFTGYLNGVNYKNRQCILGARDRFWDFSQLKIGDTDSPINIPDSGGLVPSEIAWVLCTCYGQLDTNKSGLNPDIHWESFAAWAEQFSTNNVLAHSYYDGKKIIEALSDLAEYTDSAIVIGGDGKIHFNRFEEVDSNDYAWDYGQISGLEVDVNKRRLVNRQWVYWDYSVESEYWQSKVYHEDTISIDTYGLYEEIEKRETIWYVDSVSALNIAQRRTILYSEPPRLFELETALDGIWRGIGETARFVDSFFNVTSGSGWRIMEENINLDSCLVKKYLDEATVLNGFRLDISYLDGDDVLL